MAQCCFSLLQVGEGQLNGFMAPQPASQQHSQKSAVPFALQSLRIGRLPEGFALFDRQPVAQTHSEFLNAFHSPNTGGEIGTEETAIGGFVGEPPNGSKT